MIRTLSAAIKGTARRTIARTLRYFIVLSLLLLHELLCSRSRLSRLRAYPCGECLPFRIVLRSPVLAPIVEESASRRHFKRVDEELALERIARNHHLLDGLEVLAGFLFVPGGAPGRERLQTHRSTLRMAGVAGGVALPPRKEDWLDARLEELEIQRRRRGGRSRGLLSQQCSHNPYQSGNRHKILAFS